MITELQKYLPLLEDIEHSTVHNLLDPTKLDELYSFYEKICNTWDEIFSSDLPPFYQSAISFTLMVYFDFNKLEKLFDRFPTYAVAANYIMVLANQGKYKVAKDIITTVSTLNKEENVSPINLVEYYGWIAYLEGLFYHFTEADKAFEKMDYYLKKVEEVDATSYVQLYALRQYFVVSIRIDKRHFANSMKEVKKGIKILQDNNIIDYFLLGNLCNVAGLVLTYSGSDEAKYYLKKSIDYFKTGKIIRGEIVARTNLGSILIYEGNFDESIKNFRLSAEYMLETGNNRNAVISYLYMYQCLRSMGRLDEAEKELNIAMKIAKTADIENESLLLDYAELCCLMEKFDTAEENLKRYYKLMDLEKNKESNPESWSFWLLGKGFLELKKKNFFEAEKYLKLGLKIGREKENKVVILQALMYLIELLITKIKIEEDEIQRQKIINEIEQLGEECVILLQTFQNIFHLINYNILLSTAYIMSNKLDMALHVLKRARKLAEQYKLRKQLEIINSNFAKIKRIKASRSPSEFKEKMRIDLLNQLSNISTNSLQATAYLQNEIKAKSLLALLVILPSGLPIYKYKFKEEYLSDDDLLLSGLINAIQKFSAEISWRKGKFRLLQHEDYVILLEPRAEFTVAIFAEGVNYELLLNLVDFADKVEENLEIDYEKLKYLTAEELRDIKNKLDVFTKEIFIEIEQRTITP